MRKDNRVDVDYVKSLVQVVDNNNLELLSVNDGPILVEIKGRASVKEEIPHYIPTPQVSQNITTAETEDIQDDPSVYSVTSPLVGTFYTSQSPDMPPYVAVGDMVSVGTELGLIEAMKVFSPIPSEVAGEVISINAKNGELVKQGQVLMKIRLS
ncbi:MAG: hypothetical protein IJS60_01755 [Abditibacteriota bacterium]|nr:hypothetical protein [Abditibacteriota bacterium]